MFKRGIVIIILLLQSCQKNTLYNEYKTLDNTAWKQNEIIQFKIPVTDTINHYNLYINIRNTKDYKYSNLFIIGNMIFPDKSKVIDTLEYEMTDAEGNFLGSGFSDIKENKLYYKENIRFFKSGTYLFEVRQAMRKAGQISGIDPLEGIKDVGFSIEKVK